MLVDEQILYKRRGIGMFVKEGGRDLILKKRKNAFQESYVDTLLKEAKHLQISKEDLPEDKMNFYIIANTA